MGVGEDFKERYYQKMKGKVGVWWRVVILSLKVSQLLKVTCVMSNKGWNTDLRSNGFEVDSFMNYIL